MKKYLSIIIGILILLNFPIILSEQSNEQFDYVIITSDNLVDTIESSSFIDWKTQIGFNVKIVSISDQLIQNQEGNDIAEQIRNFLREYYQVWNIQFVLIIGDSDKIPMRYCYPNPNNHQYDPLGMYGGDHPTDYYYADLSLPDDESWDRDGDGFYGEYGDDKPDFEAEVYIGRIPIIDSDRVGYTLDKIVRYEQDTGKWKNNALHASSFFYFKNQDHMEIPEIDTGRLWNKVADECMVDWNITRYCEKEGLFHSAYQGNPISEDAIINDWKNNQYGIVNWGGHGNPLQVVRYVWNTDDGNGIPEMTKGEISTPTLIDINSDLDDDYPSIVCAFSCMVGFLDTDLVGDSLLGVDLLTKPNFGAAVGIICNSKVLYAMEFYPEGEGLVESIYYYFYDFLINNNQLLGEALYNAKYHVNSNFPYEVPSEEYIEYVCQFIVNLYGDPSLNREGVNIDGRPEKPILQGPSSGNIGVEYTFQASSIDLEGDDLFYYFEWGDGSNSNWIGPTGSEEMIQINHSWAKKGSYEIKVQVKDTDGHLSEWSDSLVVNMPRNKIYDNIFIFFERFFNLFPFFNWVDYMW
ncbi:MAG: hypothetical protein DRN27_10110 [Thermoplasmata archaeon]|nr:MAG: hypothetical protein DRN27_10110 [Thermoplasmata archaeon]